MEVTRSRITLGRRIKEMKGLCRSLDVKQTHARFQSLREKLLVKTKIITSSGNKKYLLLIPSLGCQIKHNLILRFIMGYNLKQNSIYNVTNNNVIT